MNILSRFNDLHEELRTIRRDIHAHPETAFEEERTAEIVASHLAEWGLEVHRGLAKTGVVATLRAGDGKRAIGLRADMDALHITEQNAFDHRSTHLGKMHACGHDGHTAMLLGAARYLSEQPDFNGTVHFIFQPAEEGEGGGRVMVEEGLFQKFPCDAVYGLHNLPGMEVGKIAVSPGPRLAASDTWKVRFNGLGGHGAMPHLSRDPTLAASQFVLSAQSIVSRNLDPMHSAVISTGHIHGGEPKSPNIIPGQVYVTGTARSFLPEVRDLLEEGLGRVARASAEAHGLQADYEYIRRYPPVINAETQSAIAAQAAEGVVGGQQVVLDMPPAMGGEDFAFMLQAVPGAFAFIGNGPQEGGCLLHNAAYDFNDEIIPIGSSYWVELVRTELPGV